MMRNLITTLMLAAMATTAGAADKKYNEPSAGNPIIPGYFADPTVKKFGDTYYIYATTDGNGAGFGPSQVWVSKDFVNWTIMPMNWPDSHWIWAPDVIKAADGTYRFFYCQPCQLYEGIGKSPRGPWQNILGESEAVLVPDRFVTNVITLDGQAFTDDDGSTYLYWGTWGIYKDFGCGVGKMTPDLKGFTHKQIIPNTQVTDFFEAPFVLKKDGTYYFMYSSGSCHDETYRVQYATSKEGPMGPFTYRGTILETNGDGTVHGPGHHSVLQEGDKYYIVYHRHDNPQSTRGMHRQLCADVMTFAKDGSINVVTPTHEGIGVLGKSVVKSRNLALGCKVTASSFYDSDFRPEYAVDDNNGTLWRPLTDRSEWLQIDLGKEQRIRTIWTQFEYATAYYQYVIETSVDGKAWTMFADKSANMLAGSPMADFGDAKARYVRLTFLNSEKNGYPGAIWNIKVFGGEETSSPQQWMGLSGEDWNGSRWLNRCGMLGGAFKVVSGNAMRCRVGGKEALRLEPGTELVYSHNALAGLKDFTCSYHVFANGKWTSKTVDRRLRVCGGSADGGNAGKSAPQGTFSIKAGDEPMVIANLRLYNWELSQAENEYDATTDIRHAAPADKQKLGTVVDITADDFAKGDTVPYIPNHGLKGMFETLKRPVVVDSIDGRKAFRFTGEEEYRSDFGLPATMLDNAPYTLEAWILNPEMDVNECVADFTTSHDELEKIMLVSGTEPRCGLLNHYGWYEDVGIKDGKERLEGKWEHLYVCFDGRTEKVYVNGTMVSSRDIQLLVKPSQFVRLGRNNEGEWPFSGYLHSIKLLDEYVPFGE